MYFKKQETEEPIQVERSNILVIVLTTAATIAIGVVPGIVAEMFKF
jgi:hypothetical protein